MFIKANKITSIGISVQTRKDGMSNIYLYLPTSKAGYTYNISRDGNNLVLKPTPFGSVFNVYGNSNYARGNYRSAEINKMFKDFYTFGKKEFAVQELSTGVISVKNFFTRIPKKVESTNHSPVKITTSKRAPNKTEIIKAVKLLNGLNDMHVVSVVDGKVSVQQTVTVQVA